MIVLASASAARQRLLLQAGIDITVDAAHIDEAAIKRRHAHEAPEDIALLLAEAKALAVSQRHPGMHVLGADQLLEAKGRLYDKPADLDEAKAQLLSLRNGEHRLISALSLVRDGVVIWRHVESAALRLRAFSDGFLQSYLEREGDFVLQSVGAYRIEGLGAQLMDGIDGDNFTIQGLPLLALLEKLRDLGEIAR